MPPEPLVWESGTRCTMPDGWTLTVRLCVSSWLWMAERADGLAYAGLRRNQAAAREKAEAAYRKAVREPDP